MQSARLAHKTLSIHKLEEKKRVYVYNESEASLTHIFIKFTLFIIKYFVYCKLPLFIMLYIYTLPWRIILYNCLVTLQHANAYGIMADV